MKFASGLDTRGARKWTEMLLQMIRTFALLIFANMFAVSSAYAEPISILGLNWTQTPSDMRDALVDRGYECRDRNGRVMQGTAVNYSCKVGVSVVRIGSEAVIFDCDSINSCEYGVRDVVQSIADNFVIDAAYKSLCPNFTRGTEVCVIAEGVEGERLHVIYRLITNEFERLIFTPGVSGSRGPSFQ